MNAVEERTIALAGLLQACSLVQMLARTGELDETDFNASVQSILILDAVNTPAIFGGVNGIQTGLKLLRNGIMNSPKAQNVELLRYGMSLLHLQNQLYRNQEVFRQFARQVERLSAYSSSDQVNACSDVYKNFISELRPQIIVQGEQDFLERADVPSKVRALLLAGFRSAVLWQQVGGSRLKLVWERSKYQKIAGALLQRVN